MSLTVLLPSTTLRLREPPPAAALRHHGFFLLRTPLLPIEDFFAWSAAGKSAPASQCDANDERELHLARVRLRDALKERLTCRVIREAMYLASPSLLANLPAWERDPDSERGQKIEHALVRYFSRMTSRSTPFGLFAGCSLGQIASHTALTLAPKEEYRRWTRLDHQRLVARVSQLLQDRGLRERLCYSANSSLFIGAGRWRYAEARTAQGGRTSYHLVAVERSPHLDAVLQCLLDVNHMSSTAHADCSLPWKTLIDTVVDSTPGIGREDAAVFIHALIDSQILIADIDPQLASAEPLADILARTATLDLNPAEPGYRQIEELRHIATALATLDGCDLGQEGRAYADLAASIETHEADAPKDGSGGRSFHVDLWKPLRSGTLSDEVVREAARGVALLARLFRGASNSGIKRFKEAFRTRYEDKRVPLLSALDPECGIGFDDASGPGGEAAALIADLGIKPPAASQQAPWTAIDRARFELLASALRRGEAQIEITEDWLNTLPPLQQAPQAAALLGALSAASPDRHASTDPPWRLRVESIFGCSGIGLLGRFARSDPALYTKLIELAATEQARHPDAVLAEVAHLPPGRAGNIAAHPLLRDYEIPLLTRSAAPIERQIPLRDLVLALEQDKLVLYSRRLGRRVLPRLSSAHYHAHPGNVSLYRFLCALQEEEGPTALAWSWGPLATAEYLPRVVSRRLILSPARWQLSGARLRTLLGLGTKQTAVARLRALYALRAELSLPRLMALAEGDQTLLVDLDNVLSVEAFLDAIKGQSSIVLEESFLTSDQAAVIGPEGHFACEVVIPLIVSQPQTSPNVQPQSALRAVGPLSNADTRVFPPFDEWLYCKLYAGPASVDRMLIGAIRPLIHELLNARAIDRWFFIRYSDPGWHIRLRLRGEQRALQAVVMPRLREVIAPLIADERIVRMQLDTYEPEWDRYGGPSGVAISEELFEADSRAALELLEHVVGDAHADLRWKVALASMAGLLASLFSEVRDRLAVVEAARADFAAEFALDANTARKIGARFRNERSGLEAMLQALAMPRADAGLLQPLCERAHRLAPVVANLKAASVQGMLRASISDLARSYLHMSANRILRSASRAQEVVIYDFLVRLYRSQIALTADRKLPAREPGGWNE